MFVNHFRLIEKILLLFENNKNLENVIDNMKPPIFFKKKEFVIFQCKIWNLKLINIILTRLIELELKCKLNHFSEKILLSQFILSTSVLAKNRIKP
jgi:DNA polymerase III delta subunit